MTKRDYIVIGNVLKNFKKQYFGDYNNNGYFDILEFLINEFAYVFEEDNKKFNEQKFRKFINN